MLSCSQLYSLFFFNVIQEISQSCIAIIPTDYISLSDIILHSALDTCVAKWLAASIKVSVTWKRVV